MSRAGHLRRKAPRSTTRSLDLQQSKMMLSSRALFLYLLSLLLIALGAVAGVLFVYRRNFSGHLSLANGDWGTFGDFVGGTLNPLFALLSFLALLATLTFQWISMQRTKQEVTRTEYMRRFEVEEDSLEQLAVDMTKNLLLYVTSASKEEGEKAFLEMLENYAKGERNIFLNKLKQFFVISSAENVDKLLNFADCSYALQGEQYVRRFARLLQEAQTIGADVREVVNYRVTAKLYDAMLPHYQRHAPNFRGDA